jgi:hypothetical protein
MSSSSSRQVCLTRVQRQVPAPVVVACELFTCVLLAGSFD